MATLQKLRNMGPVLVAVVGLALAAFILGDAFRLSQSPQGSQAVGSVNGEEILAIANDMGFTEGKVKSILFRTRQKLADRLTKEGIII